MSLENKRILVIGGAGFVGSHIVDQLVGESPAEIRVLDNFVRGNQQNLANALAQHPVQVIEGDITDPAVVAAAVDGVDVVFHLAALWLWDCVNRPRAALEVNINGTFNIVEACAAANVKRVVFSSSASVYGDAVEIPMTESHPFNNRTFYGATKIAGEQFFRAFNEAVGLSYIGLRYMNVYGPRMDDKGAYVSVVVKVLDRIDRGEAPVIHGDGSQTYDFVHVSDVARANLLAATAEATDVVVNVGTGIRTSINDLVLELVRASGSDLEPQYDPQEQIFVSHRVGSTELAEKKLGFRSTVELPEGLRGFVEWRKSQKESRAAS